jgi:hypothetical protein
MTTTPCATPRLARARIAGEARVYNLFNPACGNCVLGNLDFAQGHNLSNSMPLFVPVTAKLSLDDVMVLMRTHFEGSYFENRGIVRADIGAGPGHSPYRFRPLVWKNDADGNSYLNERTVGTQQSGWAFVAQSRGWLPPPIRALSWFAPDDSSTSPRVPTYGCVTRIPPSFGSRVGQIPGAGVPYAPLADSWTMSLDSAFWIWNLVRALSHSRACPVPPRSLAPDLRPPARPPAALLRRPPPAGRQRGLCRALRGGLPAHPQQHAGKPSTHGRAGGVR